MRAYLISSDETVAVREVDPQDDRALAALVGGDLQGSDYPGRADVYCYLNEEGKIHGLPVNRRATRLLAGALAADDWIAGNLVICGFDTATGANLPCPDLPELAAL
jgi:hypothetical protein